jgi:branched-chain amino acid transport system substrate-binding protein
MHSSTLPPSGEKNMGSPRSRLLATSLALLAAGSLLAACGPRVPETIKIGVAQPLSGPSAARGQDLVNGALLAAADINASNFKVAGKQVKFEIVPMDDKADKEEAKKVARALCDQKVVAVIGHLSSDVTEATVPVYASGNVPQLFTSSAAELTKLGAGNAFRLIANDDLQAQAIASYAAGALKANKVAILYEDTTYGAPLAKGASAALAKAGRKVEPIVPIDNKTTSFGPFVAQLKAAKPDVLIALVRDNQLLPLFEQMNAAGLGDVPVVGEAWRGRSGSSPRRPSRTST